jgi:spore coat polysaccharide biosynthesis protein SpsF (cytidylyltransferase family)
MIKVACIIQARLNSSRLPGKVLFDIEGKTVLERVVERAKRSKFAKEVIVATTIRKDDLAIVNVCSSNGIRVYCGSEEDVLDRYYQVASLVQAENIVRITADCPLIDPDIMDKVIRLHFYKKADYSANTIKETFPDGEDVEVFKFETLKKAWENANLFSEREHVTAYIKKHPEIFKLVNLECKKDMSKKRWTLDDSKDYIFIKAVYENLYKKNPLFGMNEILRFISKNPKLERINKHIIRNEGYLKSLREDKVVKPHY